MSAIRAPSRRRFRLRPRTSVGQALTLTVLVVACAIVLLPIGWMVTIALKPDDVPAFRIPAEWFPTRYFDFENFARSLTLPERPFGLYIVNTLIIFVGNVVGTILSCSLAGYAFARLQFRGRDRLFQLLILTMLIPWQALMVPAVPHVHQTGLVRDVPAAHRPGVLRERLLHLPDAPVHADHPTRARRGGTDRRSRALPDLLVRDPAAVPTGPGGVRGVRLPRHVERPARAR